MNASSRCLSSHGRYPDAVDIVSVVPTEPLTSSSLPPWRPLLRAAQEKEGRSPMRRWVQMATTGTDGWPRVRTLVFRGWRDADTVELLTDQRSRKVTELNQNPQCELCWLLPKARCQFRFKARRLTLHPDDQERRALQHWVQLSPGARALWGWPSPGEPLASDANFPEAISDGTPPPTSFQLLSLRIQEVELLELIGTPHRRRRWMAQDGWIAANLNP